MTDRRQSKPRHKWTEQMTADLPSCKREAVAMTRMEQPSLGGNWKKKGYIRIMKELWDAKGYGDLGLSSQNLRDQAARLEKTLQKSTRNLPCDAQTEGAANSRVFAGGNLSSDAQIGANSKATTTVPLNTDLSILEGIESESQYADLLTTSSKDLHTTSTSQIPGDQEQTEQGENNVSRQGCLPDYKTVYKPSMINWGKRSDGSAIVIPTSIITDAYNEIATWRKYVFLVPYGKVGRDFIDQITLHINDWNNGSDNQHICLKAAFVLLALGLQKPNAKSKAKDHQYVLSKGLTHWRQGEINKLLREGRIIQGRIGKLKASDPPDKCTHGFCQACARRPNQLSAALPE